MKVSTQILAGYSILLVLMTGAIGYDLLLVREMRAINEELSLVHFPRATSSVQVEQTFDDLEIYTLRYLLLRTQDDVDGYRFITNEFERALAQLERVAGPEVPTDSQASLTRLRQTWSEYLVTVEESLNEAPSTAFTELPPKVADQLSRMEAQVKRVAEDSAGEVTEGFQNAAEINERANRAAFLTAGAALLVAGGVAFIIVRSITGGLARLTEGTRWIEAGRLDRRIPEDRNDEFGELAHRFNNMAHRLEELDKLKKDFVSAVSHELKSPIAASREIVQLLLDEVPGPLNAEQRRLLELSTRSSRRLSSMVGTLLDMARMDAGTIRYDMKLSEIDTLVRSTIEEFEALARDRGLEIVTEFDDEKCFVRCDPDRITQVIGNVIDNAIKFAPRGSKIRVGIEDVADPEAVVISIADAGPGIADRHKQAVFARFQQVRPDGAKHPRGGTGLGLAICRDIMTAHDGRIWVEDNEEGGSTFRVLLPL